MMIMVGVSMRVNDFYSDPERNKIYPWIDLALHIAIVLYLSIAWRKSQQTSDDEYVSADVVDNAEANHTQKTHKILRWFGIFTFIELFVAFMISCYFRGDLFRAHWILMVSLVTLTLHYVELMHRDLWFIRCEPYFCLLAILLSVVIRDIGFYDRRPRDCPATEEG